MKKDINIQIKLNDLNELSEIIKKIDQMLEKEFNSTCTLNVEIIC